MKPKSNTSVLLINLGTPEKPTAFAVYKFLSRFLSDPRVIELPKLIWRFFLYTIVLPIRSLSVAQLYKSIWTVDGSPLKVQTKRLCDALGNSLQKSEHLDTIKVFYAMTYSSPKLDIILKEILNQNISQLIILPLFPQYSSTTTAAAFDAIAKTLKAYRKLPSIYFIHEYANTDLYKKALSESITEFWNQHGRSERLLFSFHGIPKRYEDMGDPYRIQCEMLVEALVKILKIPENSYGISYQSRFGWNAWLKPSTTSLLQEWAINGIKSVDVISPSFAVDCLETLEEINIQMRQIFIKAGGHRYQYIPALNDKPAHVNVLKALIEKIF